MTFSSKFKSPSGSLLYKALFLEITVDEMKDRILYTLKDEDYKGYPSLRRLYLEENDVTEYTFATKYFHSLKHWETLCDKYWFKPHIDEWRKELELKLRSAALKALIDLASNPTIADSNPTKASVNRFLVEGGWRATAKEKRINNKVQPTKEEISSMGASKTRVSSDFDRILSPNKDLN